MPTVIIVPGGAVATSLVYGNDVTHKEALNPDDNSDHNATSLDYSTNTQNPPRRSPPAVYRVTSLPLDAYSTAAKSRMEIQDVESNSNKRVVLRGKVENWWSCCYARWFGII